MSSDVGAVVAYLGALAERDATFKPNVGPVTFVRPGDRLADSPGLKRMQAVDLLQSEEQLVREGNLWILGEIGGVEYRWPIRQRRVVLNTGGRTVTMHTIDRTSQADGVVAHWHLSAGLAGDDDLSELEVTTDIWRLNLTFDTSNSVGSANRESAGLAELVGPERAAQLRAFLDRFLAAAGLPSLEVRTDHQQGSHAPHVFVGRGFFLERHPYELNRASALKLWRDRDLSNSVLAALYDNDAPRTEVIDEPLLSPLPLNETQRQAIETTRFAPITMVSGPPGTGKSHLVAAAAIDQIAQGRSVLVASQSMHARDVVIDLLERYPMVEPLRFGDDASARRIGDKLAAGVRTSPPETAATVRARCETLEREVEDCRHRLLRRVAALAGFADALTRRDDVPLWLAQRDLDVVDVEATRHAVTNLDATGLLGWFRRRAALRTIRGQLGDQAVGRSTSLTEVLDAVAAEQLVNSVAGRNLGLDELWQELEHRQERWRQTVGDLLEVERQERAGRRSRQSLQRLASALRLSPVKRRQELAAIGSRFLDVLPLWVGTLGEIEAVLPVEAGLFDLVILDEASQISQVAAVPALARARQALIVGDSRQLRHVSFVADAAQAHAAQRFAIPADLRSRLNDRTNSIFDAAAAVAPTVELDEHFRSVPHIIGFSDRHFYDGGLRLMTQHPRNEDQDAISVVTVEGVRDEQRVVQSEVTEVLRLVRNLIDKGTESIGVVSPFRAQADALEEALLNELHLDEIANHRVRVGTVHSFQGTERDHMIISTGLGADDSRALRFLEDPAVFNVMVTRARGHVTVVTSLDRSTAGNGLLGAYLRHAEEPPILRRHELSAAGWTARLAKDIADQTQARVITHYEVAGETIDIVVGVGDQAFGIETEIHAAGAERHLARRLALQRAGWEIVSVHRASCYGREEEVIAGLLARIERDGLT